MGKYRIVSTIVCLCMMFGFLVAQENAAHKYKLDYNIPESPAFAILDANPTVVTRGGAAQELVVNLANSFISSQEVDMGFAVDFNPYFVLGGRLENIKQYRENGIKRLLANTQFSFASTTVEAFPDDLVMSAGARITLFDSKDLLKNKELGKAIDDALMPDDDPDPFGQASDEVVENPKLKKAYEKIKEEMRDKIGGAVSIGVATAGRFKNSDFKSDSLQGYRNQAWVSAEYSFGKGINMLALIMYRNNVLEKKTDINELKWGMGLRYLSAHVNIGGEVIYSSEKSDLDLGVNIEILIMKNLILYASIGNRSEIGEIEDNKIRVTPGLKWNLSEMKR
ncbi:hypothetical protein [Ulvibacter antarcticus]|uniref:Type IX secretion system PorP/SprF family membrane protein n=1 Tax=Ulvibacter antarcticus TaxID=442714 RepID=A0A3L9YFA6_9FLAO|nr:hypothetical protein [Ulvibacter antarcticus]RMA56785.1 hypothetical protein BXY75_3304 [Ulvibacter antarcticus]